MTTHRLSQIEIINQIENQIKGNNLGFSTVSPVENFETDPRMCLTSVHLPSKDLILEIQELINPLKSLSPEPYYYPKSSLHMTIKNIRVINNPPRFNEEDIRKAKEVFSRSIPNHKKFNVYFFKLLLFPNNLTLMGTTDPELDSIVLDLDKELRSIGLPDDKHYINSKYFFANITLARFSESISQEFADKVSELSANLKIDPYTIDSVSLVTSNAVLKRLRIIDTWQLN